MCRVVGLFVTYREVPPFDADSSLLGENEQPVTLLSVRHNPATSETPPTTEAPPTTDPEASPINKTPPIIIKDVEL